MSSSITAIVVAVISAILALATAIATQVSEGRTRKQLEEQKSKTNSELEALRAQYNENLERVKDEIAGRREQFSKVEEADRLVGLYRDPLLQSSFDLQSRIYNVLRPGGFAGGRDPDYFRLNTLFVLAEFLAWIEIIRREMQFLDLGGVAKTKGLNQKIERIRGIFASTSSLHDEYYIYRGQQRAIGEIMMSRTDIPSGIGPRRECICYASFVARQHQPEFMEWFGRLGPAIERLPGQRPDRLVRVQHALVELITSLDPAGERFGDHERLRLL